LDVIEIEDSTPFATLLLEKALEETAIVFEWQNATLFDGIVKSGGGRLLYSKWQISCSHR
jgi:hypothetical protein